MDAYKTLQDKEKKGIELQRRRTKLSKMLALEREQLHVSSFSITGILSLAGVYKINARYTLGTCITIHVFNMSIIKLR